MNQPHLSSVTVRGVLEWFGVSDMFVGVGAKRTSEILASVGSERPRSAAFTYVAEFVRDVDTSLASTSGVPLSLWGGSSLGSPMDGYDWNPVDKERIDGWPPGHLVLGDEEGDPFVVDVGADVVRTAYHGMGSWDWVGLGVDPCRFLLQALMRDELVQKYGFDQSDEDDATIPSADGLAWARDLWARFPEAGRLWPWDFDAPPMA